MLEEFQVVEFFDDSNVFLFRLVLHEVESFLYKLRQVEVVVDDIESAAANLT